MAGGPLIYQPTINMCFDEINIKKCLRNQKFCVHLLLPNRREYTTTKDILVSCSNLFGRSLVALLPRVVVTVWQNKRGCALSVYTYIKRIFDLQCQTVSRICSRRKVRRVQTYSLRNRLNLSLTSRTERSQSVYNHSLWTILKSSPRCFVYLCMSF